ncbi:hypothetical protein [Actinoplanes sp. NPDC049265]|uniref:hypothetical protein n=1 Tax=Actinoplanes sp. NPDC049265 TaxID=3363902 RepID=UPI00371FCA0E
MAAGILSLLCLGGVGVFVSLYDRATKIDRSEPDVVTDSFLIAFLVDRDDKQSSLFTCEKPDLRAVAALRSEILRRETEQKVSVMVSWGALTRTTTGQEQESVGVTLTISGFDQGQMLSSRDEDWQFDVKRTGDQWQLCGGSKMA